MPGLVASSCPPPSEELTSAPVSPIPALSDNWKAWNEFVEATPETGFMQSSWWVDFRNTCGFENFGITLKGENGIAGGAVVLKFWYAEDSCFYYIQDGPVLPCDDPLVAEEIFGVILNDPFVGINVGVPCIREVFNWVLSQANARKSSLRNVASTFARYA